MYPFRLGSGQGEGHIEGIAVKMRKVRTKERLHRTDTDSVGVVAALCILALMRTQANDIFLPRDVPARLWKKVLVLFGDLWYYGSGK